MSQTIAQKIDAAASRNATLLRILSETDSAPALLQEQTRLLTELQGLLKTSDEARRKYERARDRELKDHEKYRDSTARRFLHKAVGKGASFAEKAAKEEREYFEALQNLHREENLGESLRAQLEEATKIKAECDAEVSRRTQAQRELDTLYSDIFGGHTQDYPEEDEKERASEAALHAYHETRMQLETEQQVARHIRDALKLLEQAVRDMDSALSHSRVDMIGFDMASHLKRNSLHKAEMGCTQAKMRIMQAQALQPSIRDLPSVNIDQGGIVMDVVFDNIFSDMDFHQRIKQSKTSVVNCRKALEQTSAQCVTRQLAIIEELNKRQSVLDTTRRELQDERAAIFARVLSLRGDDGLVPDFKGDVKV